MIDAPSALADLSSAALRAFLDAAPHPVVLWPVGSTEPHGPHLPLSTDVILAEENAHRAAQTLRAEGVSALVAPTLPYGVTDFAAGFAGSISVPKGALIALLVAGAECYLRDGFAHVCLVNHHLEPGQLAAVAEAARQVADVHGAGAISAPEVISRRWGRRLTAEFKSGACHAGCYESSLVLAAQPGLVDKPAMQALPEVPISLSVAIKAGQHTFLEAGADHAYTGAPAQATAAEGQQTYRVLTEMVVTEVREALGLHPPGHAPHDGDAA